MALLGDGTLVDNVSSAVQPKSPPDRQILHFFPETSELFINTTGHILHSVGDSLITNSTIAFNGGISGDATLSAARSTW